MSFHTKNYLPNVAEELYTANLIAIHADPSLMGRMNDAEQYHLENTILQRVGYKK